MNQAGGGCTSGAPTTTLRQKHCATFQPEPQGLARMAAWCGLALIGTENSIHLPGPLLQAQVRTVEKPDPGLWGN